MVGHIQHLTICGSQDDAVDHIREANPRFPRLGNVPRALHIDAQEKHDEFQVRGGRLGIAVSQCQSSSLEGQFEPGSRALGLDLFTPDEPPTSPSSATR
jgi:hypothetical protein